MALELPDRPKPEDVERAIIMLGTEWATLKGKAEHLEESKKTFLASLKCESEEKT